MRIISFFRNIAAYIFKNSLRLARGRKLGAKFPFLWRIYRFCQLHLMKGVALCEVDGRKMYVNLDNRSVDVQLFLAGFYEDEQTEVDLLKSILGEGMTFVDDGAHIGYYALLASKIVGPSGRVIAFEPDPDNFKLMSDSIRINRYANVEAVQKAVSSKSGKAKLYLCDNSSGDRRIFESNDGRTAIEVETTALDDFFKGRDSKVDVLKMDIEGAEVAALQGMRGLLERNPDVKVITEFYPSAITTFGFSPRGYLEEFVKMGYKIYNINETSRQVEPVGLDEAMTIKGKMIVACNFFLKK